MCATCKTTYVFVHFNRCELPIAVIFRWSRQSVFRSLLEQLCGMPDCVYVCVLYARVNLRSVMLSKHEQIGHET